MSGLNLTDSVLLCAFSVYLCVIAFFTSVFLALSRPIPLIGNVQKRAF